MHAQTSDDDKQPHADPPPQPSSDDEAAIDVPAPTPADQPSGFLPQLEAIGGLALPFVGFLMAWLLLPSAKLGAVDPNDGWFKFFNAITFGLFTALPWLAGTLIFVLVLIVTIPILSAVFVGDAIAAFSLLGDTYGGRYRHLRRPLAALGLALSLLAAYLLLTKLWRLVF